MLMKLAKTNPPETVRELVSTLAALDLRSLDLEDKQVIRSY